MFHNLFSVPRFLTFAFYVAALFTIQTTAQNFQPFATAPVSNNAFANPVLKFPSAGCTAENLRVDRFAAEIAADERVKICRAVQKTVDNLNQTAWSPALAAELQNIWQAFSNEPVVLGLFAPNSPSQSLAMAEPFPAGGDNRRFHAAVYLRAEKSDHHAFFQIFLHELRHVLDFHETWKNKTALDSLEIERRAFHLMGKLTRETPERESFSGVPKFWKESWRKLSETEIVAKRVKAVEKYLRGKKLYRDLAHDPQRRQLDYSYLKVEPKAEPNLKQPEAPLKQESKTSGDSQLIGEYDEKKGERLPVHKTLPTTGAVLAQKIQDTDLNLEKPKNPRDPKEILRVALSNEKKLFYGMSNFVYDQKLNFQCLKKGKIAASFSENNTVARTDAGDALFKSPAASAALPCVLSYADLETDFTDTFWASPALEKMPIYFSGFQVIEGANLAVYSVLPPSARLFNELAAEYPQIRPFRVPVGTIYVSPQDGQIVRFGGTSYPEENVTGTYAQTVRCTYYVKAVRQKLNIEDGLWVTVHVGTVAVASVQGKVYPFNYTVKFENYRQSETGVKILDDEEVVAGNLKKNVTKEEINFSSRER